MAIPIKQVPILSGQIAEEFIREADENKKLPRHRLSSEEEATIRNVMRKMDEFVPSWKCKK